MKTKQKERQEYRSWMKQKIQLVEGVICEKHRGSGWEVIFWK